MPIRKGNLVFAAFALLTLLWSPPTGTAASGQQVLATGDAVPATFVAARDGVYSFAAGATEAIHRIDFSTGQTSSILVSGTGRSGLLAADGRIATWVECSNRADRSGTPKRTAVRQFTRGKTRTVWRALDRGCAGDVTAVSGDAILTRRTFPNSCEARRPYSEPIPPDVVCAQFISWRTEVFDERRWRALADDDERLVLGLTHGRLITTASKCGAGAAVAAGCQRIVKAKRPFSRTVDRRVAVPALREPVTAGMTDAGRLGVVVRAADGQAGELILRGARGRARTLSIPPAAVPTRAQFVKGVVLLFAGQKIFRLSIKSGAVTDLGVDESYDFAAATDGHLVLRYPPTGSTPARLVDVPF
jgi:hypothetical protein